MRSLPTWMTAAILAAMTCNATAQEPAGWQPVRGHIMTRWAEEVSPTNALPEYPRPMMVRDEWMNLNGLWECAVRPRNDDCPEEFDGNILVPYAIESALSGVGKAVGKENRLWYRRSFELPKKWRGKRALLHFGAVDWETTVWVNGQEVGRHCGGYDPFAFDVTSALKKEGAQEITLAVWDPVNEGFQPRGKQVNKPGGIWYTSVTGIWQTVWLEPVPLASIDGLKMTADVSAGALQLTVQGRGTEEDDVVEALALEGETAVASASGAIGKPLEIQLRSPKLWSPDSPFLYDLRVALKRGRKKVDEVGSYFGMRKIALGKDREGVTRICLNNKPIFQCGPLDQGWWPDGLYTAPTDEALRYDVEATRKLGFNAARKHVKVEPARWYYWCDKLGLMVWQDMPSGASAGPQAAREFERELKSVIDAFQNHPSIVMWVPFNEGWGQYDTERLATWIKSCDPTRLVNNASGWADRGVGDVVDVHAYPGPAKPPNEVARAAVLGEFGGLGLPVPGHMWREKGWGYRSFKTSEELTAAYEELLKKLGFLIGEGLCAAIYTQTTDVEVEVNGLMTYDRAMVKMDADRVAEATRKLYLPPPVLHTVVPTSQQKKQTWRYTTKKPAAGWELADFDDSSWKQGPGGFGAKSTPGAVIGTEWSESDIWIRRTFELKDLEFSNLNLRVHHDEDAEIYINGQLVAEQKGYTSSYVLVPLDQEARKALKAGANFLAVHCHQTQGGQFIDVGLADVVGGD
ncbi:MAG TPA: glycoside hydrolase family 2 TIM barrel-domain containing protein [Sumerlaeia bacterium]|nr:glycoside hydrolase family 2 TIM barrel-domain containing protein [Sumerlaeia bacterium]